MKRLIVLLKFSIFLIVVQSVRAQDTTLAVTVTHIAGQNVYLDAGSQEGISDNDTLSVVAGGEMIGQLRVVSVATHQTVVAFLGSPFPVTRGARLHIVFSRQQVRSAGPTEAPPTSSAKVQPAVAQAARRTLPRKRSSQGVRIRGRLLVNFSLLDSETTPQTSGAAPIQRTFATPSLNLNATASNLPSGFRLHMHVRAEYRHSSQVSLLQTNSFRAYRLNLEKDFPFGEMLFGRFYDRSTLTGGYWDGASFTLGSQKSGFGGSAGFMPNRSNEGFSTQFPRFAGFAHVETPGSSELRYRAAISYHEIHPTADYLNHRYAGVLQEFSWGPIWIDQDLQLDQSPLTQAWVVSQFQANMRFKILPSVILRGQYTLRQPYRLLSSGDPISIRRDQAGGGVNLRFGGASLGADYRVRLTGGDYESRTYTVYFGTPVLEPVGLSISGSGNHWASEFGTALFLNGGISKTFNAAQLRLDYGFYRSTQVNQIEPIDLHRYSISTTIPFGKKLYWNGRGSLQQSPYLRNISLNTSLQIRF